MKCSGIGRTAIQRSRPACGAGTPAPAELRHVRPEASTGSDEPTSQAELHLELEPWPQDGDTQAKGAKGDESGVGG